MSICLIGGTNTGVGLSAFSFLLVIGQLVKGITSWFVTVQIMNIAKIGAVITDGEHLGPVIECCWLI